MKEPPWRDVSGGAVTSVRTWQIAHPIASKSADPFLASAVNASRPSRGGAFVARTNRAKRSMSERPSAPGLSSGSFTVSQIVVTSVGSRRFVDSHLVQVGIGREGEQARLLILPTEATDPIVARSL